MEIIFNNVVKSYGENRVLDGLTLKIPEQGIFCIMGASGIGKTTIIRLILGLEKPDSGELYIPEDKKKSVVFQEDRLLEELNAIWNIKITAPVHMSESDIINELESVGLKGSLEQPVSRLSGGMKRRVAIVRALLAESDIIVMDEPCQGLDDELKLQILDYMKRKTLGKLLIMITHDKLEVEYLNAELYIAKDRTAAE